MMVKTKLKKSLRFKAPVQPWKLMPLTVLLEYAHDKLSRSNQTKNNPGRCLLPVSICDNIEENSYSNLLIRLFVS